MAGFLGGLGAFGAGAAPGISNIADTIQSNQSNTDFGNALASIYGGGSATPQPQPGGLGGILSTLGLGGQAQPQQPPQQPQPQGSPTGTTMPGTLGGVSGGGSGLGGSPPQAQGQAQQNQQAQGAPPQTPQLPQAPQQQQGQPQMRPQAQQGQQGGTGPLDLPTLVRNLVKQGVTGARLGNAVQKFVPLLNAQGLAQYRDLGLQLRSQQQQNLETQREFERDPSKAGSTAQNRVANQGMSKERVEQGAERVKQGGERINQGQQRIDAVQNRFEARQKAALDKLASAKTDKEALQAKADLDKISAAKKAELQQQLNIINSPGTDPEDQKAASAKVKELNQQLQEDTDAAITARRSGGKASEQPGPSNAGGVVYGPNGEKMRYKGTGDRKDPASYEAVQ